VPGAMFLNTCPYFEMQSVIEQKVTLGVIEKVIIFSIIVLKKFLTVKLKGSVEKNLALLQNQ
jgi:hypothetical protein